MFEIYGYSIATLPVICAIVYGIIEFAKAVFFADNGNFKKAIPIVAGVLGGIVGIIAFFVAPEVIPAANWWSALLIGVASGLSSVGVNQISKQMTKPKGDDIGGE